MVCSVGGMVLLVPGKIPSRLAAMGRAPLSDYVPYPVFGLRIAAAATLDDSTHGSPRPCGTIANSGDNLGEHYRPQPEIVSSVVTSAYGGF